MSSATLGDATFYKAKACGTTPLGIATLWAISSFTVNGTEEDNITSQQELGRFCPQGQQHCLLQVHVIGLCFIDNKRVRQPENFFAVNLRRECGLGRRVWLEGTPEVVNKA